MKIRDELITRALRRIRVVAMDEAATAEQAMIASDALDALASELQVTFGIRALIDASEAVDDELFLPLAFLLAAEIAPDFGVPRVEPLSRALIRLRALTNPDDRQGPVVAEYF